MPAASPKDNNIALHNLISSWRKLDFSQPPFVLAGDRGKIPGRLLGKFTSYKDFYQSSYFGTRKSKTLLHLGLTPVPYSGNLFEAKIYLLMLNPGFSAHDYLSEEKDDSFKRALQDSLRQENQSPEYPMSKLNPQFSWHGGFIYWTTKLNDVLQNLVAQKGIDYRQALSIVSKNLCIIQCLPYHSSKFGLSEKVIQSLESTRLIKQFVIEHILPSTEGDNPKTLIVLRKNSFWGVKESNPNIIVYNEREARAAHLSKTSRGGKKIAEALECPFLES